jgi:16S rRNA (uracil1498-N3)-methyltransferase
MPAERYFLEEPLQVNDKKILKETEFHHLARVMRARQGDQIEIVNGQGALAYGTVSEIYKDNAVLHIESIETEPAPKVEVILAQAMPRPNRLDFILEKGTELGVSQFWLFPGDLSVKKDLLTPNQFDRMRALTVAAMKQCGRLFLPSIEFKPSLEKWNFEEGAFFFGDVDAQAPLFSKVWRTHPPSSPLIFLTGPESGFSGKENALLKLKKATGVKLHGNILRTDTASLVALSLIEHWLLE